MTRRALFLDRDGVINVDHGYVGTRDRFEFIPGIFELCATARSRGFLPIVVTNQAGIGRGRFSEEDFAALTDWMCAAFAERGAAIAAVYHCPHHPEFGRGRYRADCPDRKPRPGMLLRAARDHDVDLARSVFVGDRESDMLAGRDAGVGCNLLFDCEGTAEAARCRGHATATVSSLSEVVPFLLCATGGDQATATGSRPEGYQCA